MPKKGYKQTKEHKQKLLEGLCRWRNEIGFTEIIRRKMSKAHKGILKINVAKDELNNLYVIERKLPKEIAKILNCSQSTIMERLKLYNVPIRGKSEAKKGEWNGVYGKKQSKEQIQKRVSKLIGHKISPKTLVFVKTRIGKSYEDLYGLEKAKVIKEKLRSTHLGQISSFKGMKRPEITGEKNPMYGKSGELSPAWLGGKSFEPYDTNFNDKFKRAIRKRDNQVCMLCGTHREKLDQAFHIHHINYDKKLSIPQNCISLCKKCHLITNGNRKYWTTFFQELLARRYDYPYENGEVILNLIENIK